MFLGGDFGDIGGSLFLSLIYQGVWQSPSNVASVSYVPVFWGQVENVVDFEVGEAINCNRGYNIFIFRNEVILWIIDMDSIVADLLTVLSDIQNINRRELKKMFASLDKADKRLLQGQLHKFNSVIDMSDYLYAGKRVADGLIVGTKSIDGRIVKVLIDGDDNHYWCSPEEIKSA